MDVVAAGEGHEAVVELLLQQQGLDVNLANEADHWTALHMACFLGCAGIVRRLLAHPSLTCHNDSDGCSPLMLAVIRNNVEWVRELVAGEGVHLETRDSRGRSPEEVARDGGYGLEAWQVVKEELGKRKKWRREEQRRTLSVEEMMAKCKGVLEKHSKQKKMILKKAKAEEAREKRRRAAVLQRKKVESVFEKMETEAEEEKKAG